MQTTCLPDVDSLAIPSRHGIHQVIKANLKNLSNMEMDVKQIRISDYNYPLPDEKIAKFPLAKRDESKLLIYNHGKIEEDIFHNISSHLPKDRKSVV